MSEQGLDVPNVKRQIDDIIIKTILSMENSVNQACEMYVPFKNNCFQVFGFDVLIDNDMKVWLIEVNLSPSLSCDSPLD
jgi:tubulin polyglutamylase TTLL5